MGPGVLFRVTESPEIAVINRVRRLDPVGNWTRLGRHTVRGLASAPLICLAVSLHCSIASAANGDRSNVSLCAQTDVEVFYCKTKKEEKTIVLCEGKRDGQRD